MSSTEPTLSTRKGRSPARGVLRGASNLNELGVIVALVVLVLIIGIANPQSLSGTALLGLIRAAAFVAIVSYGMVFLIAMQEIDLSVGSILGLSGLASAFLIGHGMPPWFALITGPVTGMLLGAVNAVLSNVFRIPVIIVSIGTLTAFAGAATVLTGGQAVSGMPLSDSFFTVMGGTVLGVPTSVWIVVVLGVVLTLVFTRTPFGARVRAIGSNQAAARFSGIRIGRTRLQVLMLLGALCGLSGVLSISYYQGADPTLGGGLELSVIAATIIGGTAITGGTGTVPGALIGALVIAVISSGLVYFHIDPNWSGVVTGATVVVAIVADSIVRRRRAARVARVGA